MTQLYKLSERYQAIEGMMETEYETKEAIQASLADIKEQIEEKTENIAKLVLTMESSANSIKSEEERLTKRRQALENNAKWLKQYLLQEMSFVHIDKVKTDIITVSIQNNPPSAEILDLESIPTEFRKIIPETWTPDKKMIIDHFKQTGEIVTGIDIILNRKHIVIR